MRGYFVIAAFALIAGCASNTTTADVVEPVEPVVATVDPASQAYLENTVGHQVFFAYDQYTLTAQAQATLRRQAEWMNNNPGVNVVLAGNCDERGTREYNLALGARRADAAKNYLVSLGVPASRITTVSHGKERPMDTGSSEMAWSKNRNSTTSVR